MSTYPREPQIAVHPRTAEFIERSGITGMRTNPERAYRFKVKFYSGDEREYTSSSSGTLARIIGAFFNEYPSDRGRGGRITHAYIEKDNGEEFTLSREQLLFYAATEGIRLSSSAVDAYFPV